MISENRASASAICYVEREAVTTDLRSCCRKSPQCRGKGGLGMRQKNEKRLRRTATGKAHSARPPPETSSGAILLSPSCAS